MLAAGCRMHSMHTACCSRDGSLQEQHDEQKSCSIGTSSQVIKFLLLPAANCPRTYLVNPGDSCSSIELRNALSTSAFQSLNPNINCTLLLAGAPVCLPAAGERCTVSPLLYVGRMRPLPGGNVCQFYEQYTLQC